MTALPYTALVTLLICLLLCGTAANVGRARGRYGIKAPAVTGHEMFERAYRIQMNTLENAVLLLPTLWLMLVSWVTGVPRRWEPFGWSPASGTPSPTRVTQRSEAPVLACPRWHLERWGWVRFGVSYGCSCISSTWKPQVK